MKVKEIEITEALLDQITKRLVNNEAIIRLDADDVSKVIAGKNGIMYEAHQEEISQSDFMKSFFNELAVKPQVRNCTNILISIEMDNNNPLMMEDISIINQFMEQLSDDTETIWGVSTNSSDGVMTLLVICTK